MLPEPHPLLLLVLQPRFPFEQPPTPLSNHVHATHATQT